MAAHPPPPGPFVEPNLAQVEEALRVVTFPISKRDMLDQIGEEDTIVVNGRNVDLRTFVKDLDDDLFEDEAEFREAVERNYAALLDDPPELVGAPRGREESPGPELPPDDPE